MAGRLGESMGLLAHVCARYPEFTSAVERIARAEQERHALCAGPHWGHRNPPSPRAQPWNTNMGITIVQKSDLTQRKRDPRVALVLAGGAVSGGGFKLGGLKALDDFLVNRKATDFDIYVGLSAGAFLAAPLASGVGPTEMLRSIDGLSGKFSALNPLDFYNPNVSEFVERPVRYAFDLLTFLPGTLADFMAQSPLLIERLRDPLRRFLRERSRENLLAVLRPIGEAILNTRDFPFPLDYVPSGIFDNSSLERFLRGNLEHNGLSNSFKELYERRHSELYITAMNLDSAERVIFGHDEDSSVTISEAVQASTALPGFYRPARIKGVDYVDGGVRRTANIDVAIEHGADLIICYNPFRPFSNRVVRRYDPETDEYYADGPQLADRGMFTVLNQVLRTLLHSRLQLGLRQYQEDRSFRGDIVVIEPTERDLSFFQMGPLAFWERRKAARHGYISVSQSIENHYEMIRMIMEKYGISMTRRAVRRGIEEIRTAVSEEEASEFLVRDMPRREISVARR